MPTNNSISNHFQDAIVYSDDDLEPVTIRVTLGKANYVLREASEDAARKYRNFFGRAAKMTDGKVTSIDGIGDVQALLVSLCLFKTNEAGEILTNESEVVVRSWKAKVVKRLFDKAKEISNLDENKGADLLPLLDNCYKELATRYDINDRDQSFILQGSSVALDWLRQQVTKQSEQSNSQPKNSPSPTTGTSVLRPN